MQKRLLVAALVFLTLVLTSCSKVPGGERPLDTAASYREVSTGTQGVEVEFLPNYPPPTIYDTGDLIAVAEIKNKGNHDLGPTDCFIKIDGYDPNIIQGFSFPSARSCAESLGVLEGKKIYNLEGGVNQIEFTSTAISLPEKSFEYNPILKVFNCYNYHTSASPQVCIDPMLQITSEQKTCDVTDVGLSAGQGGPVGVSYVGVEMTSERALFEITVRNFGGGKVLSPFADIQSCNLNLQRTEIDNIQYSVEMIGLGPGDCKPFDGNLKLYNGQGKIFCSFALPQALAYETPLIIDLDYSYLESFDRPVKIIRTPQ
ncbi:MAG TPA: hypothetical protein VJC39_01620 [Candidatus Nanoarchaeia archaeon]|nr:hypothetical protein [Candidatus Nanoarchaeia archaeon]